MADNNDDEDYKIEYYSESQGGNIKFEQYFKEGKLHRENDKPALIEYYPQSEGGNIRLEIYYIYGKKYRENDNPSLIQYYPLSKGGNIKIKEYYKNGKLYRENEDKPAHTEYYTQSEGGNIKFEKYVINNDLYPDDENVVKVEYYPESQGGNIKLQTYFLNFRLYRVNDKPALIEYYPSSDGGNIKLEQYIINNKLYRENDKPVHIEYYPLIKGGNIKLQLFTSLNKVNIYDTSNNLLYIIPLIKDIIDSEQHFELLNNKKINLWIKCFNNYSKYENKNLDFLDALRFYTYQGDRLMHSILRNTFDESQTEYSKSQIIERINILNKGIYESKLFSKTFCKELYELSNTIILYRGTDILNLNVEEFNKGNIISSSENQFASFTSNIGIAFAFGKYILRLELNTEDIQTKAFIPLENIKSYDGETISQYPNEQEWLMPLNTKYIINGEIKTTIIKNNLLSYIIPVKIFKQEEITYS